MVFSPNACDVFGVRLTTVAATFLGASGALAHCGVSVFHRWCFRRAIEAGAEHVAALGLLAHALATLLVSSVGDQSVTIPALESVAADRV